MKKLLLALIVLTTIGCTKLDDNCGHIIYKQKRNSGRVYTVRFEEVGYNQDFFLSDTTMKVGDIYCKN